MTRRGARRDDAARAPRQSGSPPASQPNERERATEEPQPPPQQPQLAGAAPVAASDALSTRPAAPAPFLVCCVVNRVQNLRVMVDPCRPDSRAAFAAADHREGSGDDVDVRWDADNAGSATAPERRRLVAVFGPRAGAAAASTTGASAARAPTPGWDSLDLDADVSRAAASAAVSAGGADVVVIPPPPVIAAPLPVAAASAAPANAARRAARSRKPPPATDACGNVVDPSDDENNATTTDAAADPAGAPRARAPASRIRFAPNSARYRDVAAQSPAEPCHVAMADMAERFNGRIELRCLLVAPTMFHDLPSDAACAAMRARESKLFAQAAAMGTPLPSAAALLAHARRTVAGGGADPSGAGGSGDASTDHFSALLRMTFPPAPSSAKSASRSASAHGRAQAAAAASHPDVQYHMLGPVRCLPPIESAVLVPQLPLSLELIVCRLPRGAHRDVPPVEALLVQSVRDVLDADEFRGSVPASHVQNLLRATPHYNYVIGPLHEGWTSFVAAHSGVEWASFTYSPEDIAGLGLAAATASIKPAEARLTSWRHVEHFIEGDLARDEAKRENERSVHDQLMARLSLRPHDQKELLKIFADDAAFLSLTTPSLPKMLARAARDPRLAVLHSPMHPLLIEMRMPGVSLDSPDMANTAPGAPRAEDASGSESGDDGDDDGRNAATADGSEPRSMFPPTYMLL
jgi:hypothetical protein